LQGPLDMWPLARRRFTVCFQFPSARCGVVPRAPEPDCSTALGSPSCGPTLSTLFAALSLIAFGRDLRAETWPEIPQHTFNSNIEFYPTSLKLKNATGSVLLRFVIAANGKPGQVKVLDVTGDPLFKKTAVQLLNGERFERASAESAYSVGEYRVRFRFMLDSCTKDSHDADGVPVMTICSRSLKLRDNQ
jgi:TonB family protein